MSDVSNLPEESNPPLARLPLAHWHARYGARFDELHSWQVPAVYTDEAREVASSQTGLALADISFVGKVMLRGPGVADLAQTVAGDSAAAKPGSVASLAADSPVLACRLHADQLLLLADPLNPNHLESHLSAVSNDASILQTNVTAAFAALWLLGPRTDDVLRSLTHHDLAAMASGSCAATGLAGVPAILIRPPIPAMPSMQILIGWDVAEYTWESIFQAGKTWKIIPVGLDALDVILNQGAKKPKA
jgi:glycine cleavage system T protein (aminomethyltransferase)